GEFVHILGNKVTVLNENKEVVKKEVSEITWDVEAASKGGFDSFMAKEIYEQPKGVEDTLLRRLDENGRIKLDDIKITKEDLDKINKIYIVACGTAYHAGLVGKYAIEKFAKIPVIADIASEFRYSDPFIDDKTLAIFVSQSGETLDTLAALREAKERGATTLAITNVIGSSISREADKVVYTMAGPEIAVASTKAYTTQVVMFYLFSLYLAEQRGVITQEEYSRIMSELISIPEKINFDLKRLEKVKEIASFLKDKTNGFYIGRGLDYRVALEGSLKIKEVSYIHTEAFPSGELKHGTIALIEEGTPVVVLATQRDLMDKSISNIKELKARGAHVIAIGHETSENLKLVADDFIPISESDDLVSGILSVIPVQALAYYTSVAKGIDVDKPKNLAKSVTVE
ncbi:MAG: glutamine--fructose-6-phosphate transaminase (isomerizing), partial [Cetobacterium sp.]